MEEMLTTKTHHSEEDDYSRRRRRRRRPLLIFNHNPKAGGGSIAKILRGFKTNEIFCKEKFHHNINNTTQPNYYRSGCKSKVWDRINNHTDTTTTATTTTTTTTTTQMEHYPSVRNRNSQWINNTFLHNSEFSRTTPYDKERGYVIGSIREPCSQYVSLWSFASLNHGRFRQKVLPDAQYYGESPPYFNTSSDLQRFQAWMTHPSVVGAIGRRINENYGTTTPIINSDNDNDDDNNNNENIVNNVDCWVFVENFQQTLLECLERYENQGGYVDWTSDAVSQLKQEVMASLSSSSSILQQQKNDDTTILGTKNEVLFEKEHRIHHNLQHRSLRYPTVPKDDPFGDPRLHHHASCGVFYSQIIPSTDEKGNYNNLIQQVMNPRNEGWLYEQFGYEGCCIPGNNYFGSSSSMVTIAAAVTITSASSVSKNSNAVAMLGTTGTDTIHHEDIVAPPSSSSFLIAALAIAFVLFLTLLSHYCRHYYSKKEEAKTTIVLNNSSNNNDGTALI